MHGNNRTEDLAPRFASALVLVVVLLATSGTNAVPLDTPTPTDSRSADERHRAEVGPTLHGSSLGTQTAEALGADLSIGLPTFVAPSPRSRARFPSRAPSLSEPRAVPTHYDADDGAARALRFGQTRPTALASGDFDGDGVADLICGYSAIDKGLVTVRLRSQQGSSLNAPFLSSVRVIEVPVSPDYLAAGDFDGDDRWDVVVADGIRPALYLLAGDGTGGFAQAVRVRLPGPVTALAAGEINRADGLPDLAIGVDGENGPALIVFEGPQGALRSDAEVLELYAVPTQLALGRFYGGPWNDIAVAAGRELILFQGRDRRLVLDEQTRAAVEPALVERLELPQAIRAVAWGDFVWEPFETRELALLLEDGTLHFFSRGNTTGWQALGDRAISTSATGNPAVGSTGSALLPVRLSGLPTVDLVVLDGVGDRLQVLSGMVRQDAGSPDDADRLANTGALVALETSARPVAVLPMRLNTDASSDLVLLLPGTDEPFTVATAPLATLTVNTAADTTIAGDGFCSLREALINSNTDSDTTSGDCAAGSGVDAIGFNIGGGGAPATIALLSALPSATDAVTIDGTTQGCVSPPCIVLDGVGAGFVAAGLQLAAGSSTVRGLVVQRFLGDPGNSALSGYGIFLTSSGNIVEGNYVGTDITGSLARGNDGVGIRVDNGLNNTVGGANAGARNVIAANGEHGVYLSDGGQENQVLGNYVGTDAGGTVALPNGTNFGAIWVGGANNTVGGTSAGARNLISGDTAAGLRLTGSGTLVFGNYIGIDVTGTVALGNGSVGAAIVDGQNHTIGGTTAGARNVISGNGTGGIFVGGETSENNFVLGNYIGTDLTGTVDLGNIFFGVELDGASFDTTVGGTAAGARNIISGNDMGGVLVELTSQNSVLGNYIGTDVTGTVALGNSGPGVWLATSSNNTIGGTTPGSRNLISGNGSDGVRIQESSDNAITGNFIGMQVDGTSPLGNAGHGVRLRLDASSNTIGGTGVTPGLCDGPCNRIAFSVTPGHNGVRVEAGAGSAIAILGNSIDSNAELGIDLEDSGITPNDPQDPDVGANNQQNFPELSLAEATSSGLTVSGSLNSIPGTQYRLEFYGSPSCDDSGNGEGATYLGFQNVTTDGGGDVSFSAPSLAGVSNGAAITATATSLVFSSLRDSSEFSSCVEASCLSFALFGQTVLAQDPSTLTWTVPGHVQYVKGPLADVGSYTVSGTGTLPNATSLDISSDNPGPGGGFYYLVRPLACGSWQTAPGAEPARDLALP